MAADIGLRTENAPTESAQSAVSWPSILAGAVVAIAASLVLLTLGSGLGFAALSPAQASPQTAPAFTAAIGVWLVVSQWLSSALGGYVTGRLRTKWAGVHTHEVFFRDTAHGLLTWALATVVAAVLIASAASSAIGPGASAVAAVASQADGPDGAATDVRGLADASRANDPAVQDRILQAAETARKSAAAFSIFTALSMLVGAFVACVAAAIGGQERDKHL